MSPVLTVSLCAQTMAMPECTSKSNPNLALPGRLLMRAMNSKSGHGTDRFGQQGRLTLIDAWASLHTHTWQATETGTGSSEVEVELILLPSQLSPCLMSPSSHWLLSSRLHSACCVN